MSTQTTDPVIVVVQLTGGNDYLNTVVPYADSKYWDYRPVVNVPEEEILSLNDNIGFHPAMKPIADMFKEGKVAIVHGVGYENSPRSHFRSMDIWHTAEPTKVGSKGWLGQAIKEIDPNAENVVTAVNFSEALPRALVNQGVPVASVGDIDLSLIHI